MTQPYNIYVVHGYTANSQANWYPDLKNHLESENIRVHIFDMPNSHAPVEKEWLDFLEANITNLDDKSIFIGHSLGCVTILRFLENKNTDNIESLFLVSGFIENSPIPELSEFVKEEIDHSNFIETIKNRVVISAEDDDIVPYPYSEVLAKKLNAQFKLLETGKHFIDRDGFTAFPYLTNLVQATIF
ncbi:putative alpha/beta hydrolase family esterase [Dysgonomonas sp. PFB1-18]|uniref:RBBP9/YdeN family alpha/beta hydrolase n=1 Tax=unclassified Dysgonomonas TaxID=2630389 RepID=UPI002474E421|nr:MULTISPECIES: alpha/beta fold hydrolase [unclassified Dysgonomonas]MDH6311004.1 putative alpha/beta hydrolase family esterase [Dysgonomonas sp. PF1-14]MDH6340781.1 putative alpha/beta hydrolase family esterase [Dysgonomonas sp. PF1-16]MDH6382432.1 putative alpha/beta hydrolase family esterase [Dysgonomonas sp. PFB1-18]MDH6399750.1 putative alpha/beta hydrolase family esterase [Dysgonomonas sp. PF1-23]